MEAFLILPKARTQNVIWIIYADRLLLYPLVYTGKHGVYSWEKTKKGRDQKKIQNIDSKYDTQTA
jgi:hypothetical protein